jgi:hypothetical protein
MDTISLQIPELFKRFAGAQQRFLQDRYSEKPGCVNGLLDQVLSRRSPQTEANILRQALLDPYFPLGMLERTLFADVDGMRFFVNKSRHDLEPVLIAELVEWSRVFIRIRLDIQASFDPEKITCVPLDEKRHQLPADQWCTLCGVCCQIGGVPPEPPAEIRYPDHWYTYLSGEAVDNQQLCPFLFQYFGEPFFFCGIHHVKPISCRYFGEEECRRRLSERGLHQDQPTRL